jgi:uncharacterized membrane protein
MEEKTKIPKTKRIGGYLHKIVPIVDKTGNVISHAVNPLMVELHIRDIMQIIVGASILAVPVAFTEETWKLGEHLPLKNVILLGLISFCFIASFVYFNFYRYNIKGYEVEYIKRVGAIYIFSILVVGILLTLIQKCPWGVNNLLALKRIIIVSFPASMSAAVSDTIK